MTLQSKTPLVLAATAAAAIWIGAAPLAMADETTTTTTEHHDDGGPGAVITAPARAAGAVVNGALGGPSGCSHKRVTKTDNDTGETVSKSRTDCD